MSWRWGLTGVLLFVIGVFFLLLASYVHLSGGEQLTALTYIYGFISLLLIGLGLVLIFKRKIEFFFEKHYPKDIPNLKR